MNGKLKSLALATLMGGPMLGAAEAAETLKIGVIEDRSGSATFYSQESVKSIKAFAEMLNKGETLFAAPAIGKQPGILDRQIELLFEDDENNPNNTVVKARRLLERGAEVLFFLSGSGATIQGRVVCTEQKVLCMAPTNVSGAIIAAPNNDYIFTIAPLSSLNAPSYFEAWKSLGYKTVASVRDNSATAKIVGDTYQKGWEEAGFQTVASEILEVGAADANAQLMRVRQAKPDVIFEMAASASEISAIYKSRARVGLTTPVFSQNTLTGSPHAWGLAGDALNGTVVLDTIGPSNENTNQLRAAYEALHGKDSMVWLHAMVWDALAITKLAAEAAGSTEGSALRDQVYKVKDFPSSFGQPGFTLTFGEGVHNGTTKQGLIFVEFEGPRPTKVWDAFQP